MNRAPGFAAESLLMSGEREQRVLIALSMLDPQVDDAVLDDLLDRHVVWPWILMQAMQHRTLCILWENLRRGDRMAAAVRAGLAKNWILYAEQLYRASRAKNAVWLALYDEVAAEAASRGLAMAAIKGAALIGDVYTPGNRMLGDIDVIAEPTRRAEVSAMLHAMGYKHGIIDPVTMTLKPIARDKLRFWNFNSHIMPKFTLELDDPAIPFFRLSVGFDFFDPHDEHKVGSDIVLARSRPKPGSAHVRVPDEADMIVNLAAHIYREAVSATFGFAADGWHLWKFVDLRGYLLAHDDDRVKALVRERIAELGLAKPYAFALHYTHELYGDERLADWSTLSDPGPDRSFLHEMIDGTRRVAYHRPFAQRLFNLEQVVIEGLEPVWAKRMSDGEWW